MLRRFVLPVVCCASVVVGGSVAGATTPPEDSAESDAPSADTEAPDFESIEFQVDLALGLLPADQVVEHDRWVTLSLDRAVATCMDSAGFEYIALTAADVAGIGPTDAAGGSPRDAVAEWGFYVYTVLDPAAAADASIEAQTGIDDPNAEVLDELTADDQSIWYTQYGTCNTELVGTFVPLANPQAYEFYAAFEADVAADPRVAEAADGWTACMADAGHDFTDPEAVYLSVYDEALISQYAASSAWEPDSPDHEAWQQSVDDEVALALDEYDCTVELDAVRSEVLAERKDELVAQWETVDFAAPVDAGAPVDGIPIDDAVPLDSPPPTTTG